MERKEPYFGDSKIESNEDEGIRAEKRSCKRVDEKTGIKAAAVTFAVVVIAVISASYLLSSLFIGFLNIPKY